MRSPRCLPLLLLLAVGGCTHARDLSRPLPQAELNDRARDVIAVVTLASGEAVRARSLHVAPDLATWTDPETGELRSAPTPDVISVRVASKGLGTVEGVGLGLAFGTILGGSAGMFWGVGQKGGDPAGIDGSTLVGGSAGGLVGAGLGAFLSRTQRSEVMYTRPTPAAR